MRSFTLKRERKIRNKTYLFFLLFVYNPEGIESSEKELKISKASKVKWSYIPYGSMTKRRTETYVCKNNGIVKIT